MKRKEFLASLVLVCIGLISGVSVCEVRGEGEEKRAAGVESSAEKPEQVGNYKLIADYFYSYYDGYIDYVKPVSGSLRKNIKKRGRKQVIEGYVKLQTLCLDLALKFKDKDIPDKEFKSLAKSLAEHQERTSHDVPIDYDAVCVIEAYEAWSKDKVEFFKKLLRAEAAENYEELAKKIFTRKEYRGYLEKQNKSRDKLYDSFIKALKGFFPKIFGPSGVNAVRRRAREYSFSSLEKIYGPEEKKDAVKIRK